MDMITWQYIQSLSESVTDDQIKEGIEDYFEENLKYPIQSKGDVATYADLPTAQMSDDTIGYCYNCLDDGNNYAWAGSGKGEKGDGWDNLGHQDSISNSEIDGMFD